MTHEWGELLRQDRAYVGSRCTMLEWKWYKCVPHLPVDGRSPCQSFCFLAGSLAVGKRLNRPDESWQLLKDVSVACLAYGRDAHWKMPSCSRKIGFRHVPILAMFGTSHAVKIPCPFRSRNTQQGRAGPWFQIRQACRQHWCNYGRLVRLEVQAPPHVHFSCEGPIVLDCSCKTCTNHRKSANSDQSYIQAAKRISLPECTTSNY